MRRRLLRNMLPEIKSLLFAGLAVLTVITAAEAPAQPNVASTAGKAPRSLAADYLARRAGRPLLLVGAGDIASCDHGQGEYAEATAKLLEAEPDALVFTAGDNVYQDGTWEQFTDCYARSWGRPGIKARTLPAPGNHDYGSLCKPHEASAYFRYFGAAAANADTAGRGYYSLDLGAWHIVSLNSDIEMRLAREGGLSPEAKTALAAEVARQRSWLAADLAAARRRDAKCILGIWHHPRYTNALRGDDDTMAGLWELMSAAGADLVITGHEHIYENFAPRNADGVADPEGMRQFVVGTGGAGGRYAFTAGAFHFGVLKLRLDHGGYAWEFLPVEGDSMRDQGSANCSRKRGA